MIGADYDESRQWQRISSLGARKTVSTAAEIVEHHPGRALVHGIMPIERAKRIENAIHVINTINSIMIRSLLLIRSLIMF